tara:strand:+ start:151 stop:909 length:759 start_codon:yes stop_codon:yes gene_type:complete
MEYLVLGPAGMGMFAIVGSLMKYEDDLKHIKEISGSSAGAIIALGLATGHSLHDVLDRLLSVDFANLTKFKIKSFMSTYGFVDMAPIRQTFVEAYGCDPTFSEVEKKVYISAYCVNRARTEYFSVDTHPHMKAIDAVCMSLAIPFVISSVKHDGMIYLDGGTKELFPVTPFIGKKPEKIMCIRVKQRDVYVEKIKNIKQFLNAMVTTALQVSDTNTMKMGKVIELDIDTEEMLKFTMTQDEKLKLFMKGTVS